MSLTLKKSNFFYGKLRHQIQIRGFQIVDRERDWLKAYDDAGHKFYVQFVTGGGFRLIPIDKNGMIRTDKAITLPKGY